MGARQIVSQLGRVPGQRRRFQRRIKREQQGPAEELPMLVELVLVERRTVLETKKEVEAAVVGESESS